MAEKFTTYDPAKALRSDEAIAYFLEAAFEDNDPSHMAHAISIATRAKGVTKVAKALGISRQQLASSLSPDGDPTLATIVAVMKVLGLELAVKRPQERPNEQAEAAE